MNCKFKKRHTSLTKELCGNLFLAFIILTMAASILIKIKEHIARNSGLYIAELINNVKFNYMKNKFQCNCILRNCKIQQINCFH